MKEKQVILLRMLTLALLAVVGFCQHVAAHPVDSLYVKFQVSADKEKINLANALFVELDKQQITDTLYQFPTTAKLTDVEARLHYWVAEYYYDKEQYALSLEAIERAAALFDKVKDMQLRSDVLSVLSNAHFRLGDYDKSHQYLLEAYHVDTELGNQELISSDLNSLAAIYLAIQQPQAGIRFIEESIAIERRLGRMDRLAIRLGIASELYLMNRELEKAMTAIDEAYSLDSEARREERAAVRLTQKGAVLNAQQRLDEALAVANKALPVLIKANNTYSLAVCYNLLANINEKLGNRQAAINYYKQALEQSIRCGSPNTERTAEKGLWQTMRDDNPAVAMIHLERYTALTDSLFAKLASMQMSMTDLTAQNKNLEPVNTGKRQFSQFFKWGVILLIMMLVLMLAGMTYAWRKSRGVMLMQRQTQDLKSRFFTNITNELQTPLTVIMSAGQQLLAKNGKTSAEEGRMLGEMIINHGDNMLGLVNQLLEIEDVKTAIDPPTRKQGNIVMFVRMLVENFQEEARQKLLNLNFETSLNSLIVEFSLEYVRKIVHTLIANAIKFTPRNGQVTVSLELLENGLLRLAVADTGKGIPVEEMNRLFDPMTQKVDDDDGANTSVGLTLVYQIVQAMNGTIDVDSHPNQGTTFTITVPVQVIKRPNIEEESGDSIAQFAEERIRKGSKQLPLVFIVENIEDVAFFIASHLSEHYQLRLARDGREAIQIAHDLVPDLIITSMAMPVMDGWELIKYLRSTPALSHIPIIAMTSNTSEDERMACYDAGADNVLVKPFNSHELRQLADHLITQRSIIRDQLLQSRNDSTHAAQPAPVSREDRDFVGKLVDVIHAQMAKDDIDMDHIAAALQMSRKQLRARVMAVTGLNPVAYVLQVRLNYARRMITTTDLPLTKIASKCGFLNPSHFSKAFKQQFGVSPQQFRKNEGDLSLPRPSHNNK